MVVRVRLVEVVVGMVARMVVFVEIVVRIVRVVV